MDNPNRPRHDPYDADRPLMMRCTCGEAHAQNACTSPEQHMNELVQSMREVCILACRRPAEAESMASVLQVISAIEGIANAAIEWLSWIHHTINTITN